MLSGWRDTEGVGVVKSLLTQLYQTSPAERDAKTAVPNKASSVSLPGITIAEAANVAMIFLEKVDKKTQKKREWVILAGIYYFDILLCWLVW